MESELHPTQEGNSCEADGLSCEHVDGSVELVEMFAGVATSRDSNGYTLRGEGFSLSRTAWLTKAGLRRLTG